MKKSETYWKLLEYMKENPQPKSQKELAEALSLEKGSIGYNLGGENRSGDNKTDKALVDIGLVKETDGGYAWYTYRPLRERVDEILRDYFDLSEGEVIRIEDSLASIVNEKSKLWIPKIKDAYEKAGDNPPADYSIVTAVANWLENHASFQEEEWEKVTLIDLTSEEQEKESQGDLVDFTSENRKRN